MREHHPDDVEGMLRTAAAESQRRNVPVVEGILQCVMAEWDARQHGADDRLAVEVHRPRRIMLRRVAIGLAACAMLALVADRLLQSKSEARVWHNVGGLSRAELRSAVLQFASLQASPDSLPTGTQALPGPDHIPTPTLDGFELKSDSKFYDMSWWRRIAPDQIQAGRLSPVVYTRVMELRRIPGHSQNRELQLKFWTGGYAVDPVKLKPGDTVVAAREPELLAVSGPSMKTYLLTTDVTDQPEGQYFTVVVHAIYWNGFNDPVRETASTALASGASTDAVEADIGVLLPPEHSVIKGWSLHKIAPGQSRTPENRLKAGHPPRDESGLLYWPIAHIENGYKYMIEWEWAPTEH